MFGNAPQEYKPSDPNATTSSEHHSTNTNMTMGINGISVQGSKFSVMVVPPQPVMHEDGNEACEDKAWSRMLYSAGVYAF